MVLTDVQVYETAFAKPRGTLGVRGAKVASDAPGAARSLEGRVCVPGLSDAHVHMFPLAMFRLQLDIAQAGIRSIPALLGALNQIPAERRFGGWLQAAVLIEDSLEEKRLPDLAELDTRFPDTPVLLRRYCGHVAVMNTCAMRALGLHRDVPPVASGGFGRTTNGALTGQAEEGAAAWVFARAPAPPDTMIVSELRTVLDECLSLGLTSLVEAAVGFTLSYDREAAIWAALRAEGEVPVRLGFMNELTAQEAAQRKLSPVWDCNWSSETLKFFADGIIGGRTGALSQPYSDTGGLGEMMQADGVLEEQLADAHAQGWRIAVHATGDRGIERVLCGIARAQGQDTSRRHRIEHFFVPPQDGLARAARSGIGIVTQPGFLHRMGASIALGLGSRVDGTVYPGVSALAAGAQLAFSSDAPTGPLSPWKGMRHALDRIGAHGGAIGPGEAVNRAQALDAYTSGGAWVMRHDRFRGKLTPGMAADAVVLNMDPFKAPLDELEECHCVLALKDGQVVRDTL